MARIESKREKRNGRFADAAETSRELAEWRRLQRKNFEQTGPAEKERVASAPQNELLTRTPEFLLPKRKGTEPSVQKTRSSHRRESRRARATERGSQSRSME